MNVLNAEAFSAEGGSTDTRMRVGLLEVGGKKFGLDIQFLGEICMIQEILPLLTGRSDVLGAIELRGNIIPLVDPMMLCQAGACKEPPRLAAIVEYGDRMLALGVDRALNITDFDMEDIQPLYDEGRSTSVPVESGVLSEDTSINLLEPRGIFDLEDMPTRANEEQGARNKELGMSRAFLTFEAGGATFGLDAVQIYGTVPRQTIEVGTITGGDCLGAIVYLNRRVPIMDATRVLGLGDRLRRDKPEIVVVNFPDGRLLGLAVDVIQQIRMVRQSDLMDVRELMGEDASLFSSVLTRADGRQVFILDPATLLQREMLVKMSTLSDKPPKTDRVKTTLTLDAGKGANEVVRVQQRCIVFSAGLRACAKITDVVSILPVPDHLTPIQVSEPAVIGIFSFDKKAVPLVSMVSTLGQFDQQEDESMSRVLLVGAPDQRVGFLVSSVDGIETTEYIARADRKSTVSDRVAKLKSPDIKALMPFLDLEAQAKAISLHPM